MRNNFQKFLTSEYPPHGNKGIFAKTWKCAACMLLAFILGIGQMWGVDYSPLNYNGGSDLPSGYKYYGSSAGTENKSAFSITTYEGHTVFDVTAGGTGAYNKRAIEFTVSEDCTLDIEFYVGGDGRILNLFHGNSTVVHSSTGTTKGDNKYTFSYSFEDITSDQTYSLSGSRSKVYISKITFTPAVACTETAPTSVTVSGGATYDKGDALSNLSATVTGGSGTMSYQWYRNTADAATVNKDLKLANCTTATLTPSNKVGTYYYYCVASNCAGSVTSGTTSVTINANCSATGDIFTMTMNSSNAPSSEVKTPASSTMSIDTYINIDGGDIVLVTGSSQHSSITTSPKIKLGGSSGYAKITLDCPLQEGDKITFVKTNKIALAADASGTNKIQLASGTNEYTVTKEDCLYNQSNLFVLRDGNNVEISAITITRPVYRTITLEYADGETADGETADGSLDVEDGVPATKPTDPTWAHHRFDGWYNGATPYDWTANVTGDLTLTAHWTQLYTVTYEAGDGTATGDAPTQADKAETETFTVAANPFTVAGKDFVKWNDGTNDYAPGATYTVGTDNVVLTAQWKAAADKYTVIFKDGTTELGTKLFDVTTNPSDADIDKTKALNTFAAWQKEGVDIALDDAFWASVAKDAEITLTARWAKAFATSVDLEGLVETSGTGADWQKYLSDHGYAFSTSNVSLDEKKDPSENKPYDNWPYQGLKAKVSGAYVEGNIEAGKLVIIKLGHMAADATVTIDGVAQDNASGLDAAEPAGAMNYYYLASEGLLHYETTNAGACILKAITITDPFTVSFDANGGDDVTSLNGTPSVTLPGATKGTESFLGWFDGETKVGEAGDKYTPTANITLKAHWETVSTDTRISALTYALGAAAPVDIYEADKNTFNIALPYAQAYDAITVAATPNHASASIKAGAELTVSSIPGTATFTIVAQSGAEENYTVNFTKAPKDGVEIIGAVVTGNTTADVTGLYKGTASVKLNDKKIDKGDYYIYVTLKDGQTLQDGDVLVVDVNTKSGIGTQALEICTGEGNLNNGILTSVAVEDYSTGENTIVLASVPAGATSIGLKRSDNLNAKINGLKVYRAMNPVLTAIQFNDTKVDVTGTTIAATLPNGTDLSTMTITPTIVWNGAGSALAANTWEWSVANTYTVTDKDGDATVYTITLTEAIPAVDPALTYNEGAYMVGASALDLSTLIDEADSDGEITYTVKTDGGTSATITDGKFTATATGTATITATQAATVAYNAKTVDFNVVVTVATEIDGIKLVEADALTGKFVTARTLSNGENTVEGIAYTKYLTMSSTMTSFGNEVAPSATKGIYYYPSHKNIRFYFYVYNNQSSAKKIYIYTVDEDAEGTSDATSANVSVDAGRHMVYADVELTKHAAVVFGVENTGTQICQIVAVESGDELLQGGEAGYSIDYNKCYISPKAGTVAVYDGIEYKLYADAKLVSAGNVQLQTLGTDYIKFHLDAPMTVNVYADNKKYYIGSECSTDDAAMLYEATGDGEFPLAAGDWYINGADVQVKINKLSFTAPKCAEPVIDAQPASKLDFAAGDMTATVAAHATDGGTLKYQWYKAEDDSEVTGATGATLTTTAEGKYYVIVTNTLTDHSDNSVKSDEATLKYRKADDATLSSLTVSAGMLAPAFDPAVLEYNVTLPEGTVDVPTLTATAAMAAYGATAGVTNAAAFVNYEATSTVLVTAEDGTTKQTYTVHFYVDHLIATLVDVTGDMTWDFSKTGLANGAACGNKTDIIMANVDGVVNNDDFHSDNIMVNANKQADTKLQASMIMFHSTVDGLIKVVFSNTGSKSSERYLVVNGKKTDSGSKNTTAVTYYGFVPAGDVVLTVIEGDGNMLNFTSVQFTAKAEADLKRDASTGDDWMAPGELGTVCIPNGAVATGGDLYELVGKNEVGKIVFATVPNNRMTPGVPYLFQATSNSMKFYYTEEATAENPDNSGAMKGTFEAQTLTGAQLTNVYYFAGHALWSCADLTSLEVKANRAWVVLDENMPTVSTANPAPGRRFITMEAHGQNATTDIGNVQGDEVQSTKVLINGELFILRGEKMYDAKGQLVK